MEQESGFEGLFEEREWVRALAERLCADAASAEDLAQDTWLEALREGGQARGARGWLGGVLRNLAARRRTRDAARKDRERATARPEAVPGPDELLARAELQRRVLAAVANLPESYRSVVLLRHYEGLSAEDIARRSGESGSTVRNRLARAHALLRERLDRDYGARSLWSTLLVPVSWGVSKEVVTGGMLVGWKLYGGAAAALLLGALWWSLGGTSSEPKFEASRGSAASLGIEEQSRTPSPTPAVEGAEVEPQRQAVEGPERSDKILLVGELLGTRAPEGSVVLVDARGTVRKATMNGTAFTVPDLDAGKWRAVVQSKGCASLDEEVVLDGRSKIEHRDFRLASLRAVAVRFVDAQSGLPLTVSRPGDLARCLSAIATRSSSPRLGGTKHSILQDSECGRYVEAGSSSAGVGGERFCGGTLELREAPPVWVHAVLRRSVLHSELFEGASDEIVFRIDPRELERHAGGLVVHCVDSRTGGPLVGAHVEADFENGGGLRLNSDVAGLARFEALAPGPRRISVWAAGYPMVSRVVNIDAGRELELEVRVAPPERVAGRVVGPDGRGTPASLEFLGLSDDSPTWWRESARSATDSAGHFDLPFLTAGRQRVVASAGDALAALEIDTTHVEAPDVTIWIEHGTEVVLLAPRSEFRQLDVTLLDARGGWLASRPVLPATPIRWLLSSGAYELRVFDGDALVESRAFEVGAEAVVLQLGAR